MKNQYYNRLQEIQSEAIKSISTFLKNTGGGYTHSEKENAYNDEESELQDEFLDGTVCLTLPNDFEGFEDMYFISITGNQFDATITIIDENGNISEFNLLTIETSELCKLADFLADQQPEQENELTLLKRIELIEASPELTELFRIKYATPFEVIKAFVSTDEELVKKQAINFIIKLTTFPDETTS